MPALRGQQSEAIVRGAYVPKDKTEPDDPMA